MKKPIKLTPAEAHRLFNLAMAEDEAIREGATSAKDRQLIDAGLSPADELPHEFRSRGRNTLIGE